MSRFENYINSIPSNLTDSDLKEVYNEVSQMNDVFPMNYSPDAFYIKSSSEDKLHNVVNQLKDKYDWLTFSKIILYQGMWSTVVRKK